MPDLIIDEYGKKFNKSDCNTEKDNEIIEEKLGLSQDNTEIRNEFLEKRFLFKQILKMQNIRKNPISIVKRR
ncbi:MAG: hypothetical protein ABOK23_09220 [Candidatus Methanoperedens sp.]|nr:hypothetical protein [Candidatus Methanoperedens sp.]MCZ7394308.1 hypothetical protein [Candidatus Methanoperedens sp.]